MTPASERFLAEWRAVGGQGVAVPAAGVPPDAGAVPPDAGAVPPDAGAVPADAGAVPADAGAVSADAGAVPPDAGAVPPDAGAVPADAAPEVTAAMPGGLPHAEAAALPAGEPAAAAVLAILRAEGARRIIRHRGPLADALGLEAVAGLEVTAWDPDRHDAAELRAAAAAAEVGVAEVAAAVAATGTVVLGNARGRGRLVSLLPPVCIFLIDATLVAPTLEEALAMVPGGVTLVTGPSRSADIEGELVLGVHGPGRVHAVVVSGA